MWSRYILDGEKKDPPAGNRIPVIQSLSRHLTELCLVIAERVLLKWMLGKCIVMPRAKRITEIFVRFLQVVKYLIPRPPEMKTHQTDTCAMLETIVNVLVN
jgi:hypothetical protein